VLRANGGVIGLVAARVELQNAVTVGAGFDPFMGREAAIPVARQLPADDLAFNACGARAAV